MWARAEARALCEEVVSRLSPRYREALRLRYVDGLANLDAARRLGVNVELFESRMSAITNSAHTEAVAEGHREVTAPPGVGLSSGE